jgi:DNA-nicking Smr family endonuclease
MTKQKDDSFEHFMEDVKPLKEDTHVHFNGPKESSLTQELKRQAINQNSLEKFNYLSVEGISPVSPDDILEYKQPGIQDGVYKKLRLGKYGIDKSINIQQTPFEKARTLVFDTIMSAHNDGNRTILLKHGLGLYSKPFAGFLKSATNHWLKEIPEVIAFYSAQKRHGGLSAVYVLIKKNRQDKIANREINRKRG